MEQIQITQKEQKKPQKLYGYAFWKSIGEPKYAIAPMVDQSELPFRILVKKYGCTLSYTPMLNSKTLYNSNEYKKKEFSTCSEDHPVFAQLCGDDPKILLLAAQRIENEVDAIDLNFGCPQQIAKRGHYGAYLLDETDLICSLIKILHENLSIPVTCKMRVFSDEQKTLNLAKRIQEAGCSVLTVHGRTKEQNKERMGACNWDIVKKIKETLTIPVICNGGIETFEDVKKCFELTNVDAVMSGEGILANPALFSGKYYDLNDLAVEYIQMCEKYSTPIKCIKAHLFKFFYQEVKVHTDLRDKLANASGFDEYKQLVSEFRERCKTMNIKDKLGWYSRYFDYNLGLTKSEAQLPTANPSTLQSNLKINDKDKNIENQNIPGKNIDKNNQNKKEEAKSELSK